MCIGLLFTTRILSMYKCVNIGNFLAQCNLSRFVGGTVVILMSQRKQQKKFIRQTDNKFYLWRVFKSHSVEPINPQNLTANPSYSTVGHIFVQAYR